MRLKSSSAIADAIVEPMTPPASSALVGVGGMNTVAASVPAEFELAAEEGLAASTTK
jgi:hypothetical protein